MSKQIVKQYPFNPELLKGILKIHPKPYYKQDIVRTYIKRYVHPDDKNIHTIRFVPINDMYPNPTEIQMKGKFESILRRTGTNRFIQIRGDGNCYYRALIIGAIFSIRYDIQHHPSDQSVIDFTRRVEALQALFPERYKDVVNALINPHGMTEDEIVRFFDTKRVNVDLPTIRNLRAAILKVVQDKILQQAHAQDPNAPYTNSLTDHDAQALITTMGRDAEAFITLDAASIVLCSPVQIIQLDSQYPVTYYPRTDPPVGCGGRTSSPICILFKPGHYDLLVK